MTEKVKLTKTFVDALVYENKDVIYRDLELQGFGIRVRKSKKSYIVERKINGKTVRSTVGYHGEITVVEARNKARTELASMSQGVNPIEEKKQEKLAIMKRQVSEVRVPTVREAYKEFIDDRPRKGTTLIDYERCMDKYLKEWEDIPIIDVSRKMIQTRHKALSKTSRAQADLCMRFFRALYNFTIEHYLDEDDNSLITRSNPVATLKIKKQWNKVKRRRTYIQPDKIHDWLKAVEVISSGRPNSRIPPNQYTNCGRDYFITLALTGMRRSECAKIKWSSIDLEYGYLIVVDPKNGDDLVIPMGPYLHNLMKERKKLSGSSEYVFPAKNKEGWIQSLSATQRKIAVHYPDKFTPSDLRRTFGSLANSIKLDVYTIKRLLNHRYEASNDSDVSSGYIQISILQIRAAMVQLEAAFTKPFAESESAQALAIKGEAALRELVGIVDGLDDD